jgi:hypothetical protein
MWTNHAASPLLPGTDNLFKTTAENMYKKAFFFLIDAID